MCRNLWIYVFCGLVLTLSRGTSAGVTDFEKAVQRADAASASSEAPLAIHDGVPAWLVGTWVLVRCDTVYPNGRLAEPYGASPEGLWIIDSQGRYMMQIVRAERERLAADDTSKSMSAKHQVVLMDPSPNYGWIRAEGRQLHTHIAHASSLHLEDRDTYAAYQLQGDQLTYTVGRDETAEARDVLVWRRLGN